MRLLDTSTLELREFYGKNIPGYAILSHRWEDEEANLPNLQDGSGKLLGGWSMIQNCCAEARRWGLNYVWIDTCCIDKSSSADLSEAVNSIFRWYWRSKVCYAYPSDVFSGDNDPDAVKRAFAASKWFTRGWTLQELLAPIQVVFLDRDWVKIGTKYSLSEEIQSVTGIQLSDYYDIQHASVARRMSWASKRETTREEDIAYCLMGLFDVNMPLLYGEGEEKAFLWLQLQILQQSDDESIFAWMRDGAPSGLLARSPADFATSFDVHRLLFSRDPCSMTSRGLRMDLSLHKVQRHPAQRLWTAPLNCFRGDPKQHRKEYLAIYLTWSHRPLSFCRLGPLEELRLDILNPSREPGDIYVPQYDRPQDYRVSSKLIREFRSVMG